jgi:hypothetical protein
VISADGVYRGTKLEADTALVGEFAIHRTA